jgi:hypothetical protein
MTLLRVGSTHKDLAMHDDLFSPDGVERLLGASVVGATFVSGPSPA